MSQSAKQVVTARKLLAASAARAERMKRERELLRMLVVICDEMKRADAEWRAQATLELRTTGELSMTFADAHAMHKMHLTVIDRRMILEDQYAQLISECIKEGFEPGPIGPQCAIAEPVVEPTDRANPLVDEELALLNRGEWSPPSSPPARKRKALSKPAPRPTRSRRTPRQPSRFRASYADREDDYERSEELASESYRSETDDESVEGVDYDDVDDDLISESDGDQSIVVVSDDADPAPAATDSSSDEPRRSGRARVVRCDNLHDAVVSASGNDLAPLRDFVDRQMHSSATDCGPPREPGRLNQFDAMIRSCWAGTLEIKINETTTAAVCVLCNTHKPCCAEITFGPGRLRRAGSKCIQRLLFVRDTAASFTTLESALRAMECPKERLVAARCFANALEGDYAHIVEGTLNPRYDQLIRAHYR